MFDFNNPIVQMYRKDMKNYKPLNAAANIELAKQYQSTKDKRLLDKLVEGNLAIAFKIAMGYNNLMNPEDAIAVGNEALVRCAKNYNPYSGFKFSSLLAKYIEREMLTYCIKNGSTVKFNKNIPKNKTKQPPIMVSTGSTIGETDFTIGDNLIDPYDHTEFEFLMTNDEFWKLVGIELNRLYPGRKDGLTNADKLMMIKEMMQHHKDRILLHDELGEVFGCTRQNLSQTAKLCYKHLQESKRLKEIYNQLQT